MKAYNHPNVLPLYCSFVTGQDLWMVMPYISGGSVLHIMKYAYPEVRACVRACVHYLKPPAPRRSGPGWS